jgi:hypothetical protein
VPATFAGASAAIAATATTNNKKKEANRRIIRGEEIARMWNPPYRKFLESLVAHEV